MSIIKSIKNWNWKRLGWFTLAAISVPFLSLVLMMIDSTFYDVSLLELMKDIKYIYLVQLNVLAWVIIWVLFGLYYKKEK